MTDLIDALPDVPGTRRREHTRSRLVRASLDVFVDHGIDGATIDDLVSAAGFTRGAFYSSFSRKEEVFYALFETVTDEVIQMVRTSVEHAYELRAGGAGSERGGEETAVMVGVFEAIRPFGRQWYLLYTEAVTHALRNAEGLARLNAQRHRLRAEIAAVLERGMERTGERPSLGTDDLAQVLIGVFVDLMVRENLDHDDIGALAGETILRIMRAFAVPAALEG